MEKNENYQIKMKLKRNENHLDDLNESDRKMIKLMASMIVKSVIRKVEEEKKQEGQKG